MRRTEFHALMNGYFGADYAESVARDHVLSELGGRTIDAAIEAGEDPKRVWRLVCEVFDIPDDKRFLDPDKGRRRR